jgi:hypothetical protein
MNKDNYLLNEINYNKYKDINLNKPKLIANNVKNFLFNNLKQCNTNKFIQNSSIYNILLFIVFFTIFTIILISKYKGFKSPQEIYEKNIKDKNYIMSKLVYYNRQNLDNQKRIQNNLITDLPDYSNHPEASLLHRKIYF